MSDMLDTELDQNLAVDAPESDADAQVEPVEAPASDAPEAPAQQPAEWERQFPGGPDEIYRSWQETRATLTREQQQRADYERQVAEYQAMQEEQYHDPWSALPPTLDENRLQEIGAWAQAKPAEAAQWAYQHHTEVGPQVAGKLMQYWKDQDYFAATRFELDQYLGSYREQIRQELMGEIQPLREDVNQRVAAAGLAHAAQIIPNWNAWMPRITDFLDQRDQQGQFVNKIWLQHLNTASTPEDQAEILYDLYARLHARDARARATTTTTTQPAPAQVARTETQNTSDGPTRDENGRFTSDPGPRKNRMSHITGVDD